MDWFRALLADKAHSFQIVVFTCRPGDYLAASAMVAEGGLPTRTRMAGSYERLTSVERSDGKVCAARTRCAEFATKGAGTSQEFSHLRLA